MSVELAADRPGLRQADEAGRPDPSDRGTGSPRLRPIRRQRADAVEEVALVGDARRRGSIGQSRETAAHGEVRSEGGAAAFGPGVADEVREEAIGRTAGHGAAGHGAGVATFCIRREEALSADTAGLLPTLLPARRGGELLRVEGILAIREETERPLVVQAVQHAVHERVEREAGLSADRSSRLGFLALDPTRETVAGPSEAVLADEAVPRAATTGGRPDASTGAPRDRRSGGPPAGKAGGPDSAIGERRLRRRAEHVLPGPRGKPRAASPSGYPRGRLRVEPGVFEGRGKSSRRCPADRRGLRRPVRCVAFGRHGEPATTSLAGSTAVRRIVGAAPGGLGQVPIPAASGPGRDRRPLGGWECFGRRPAPDSRRPVVAGARCRRVRGRRPGVGRSVAPAARGRGTRPGSPVGSGARAPVCSGRRCGHPARSAIAAASASSRSASRTCRASTRRPSSTATPAPRARASA